MKPNIVADEMFPEGAGPYMDYEEVTILYDLPWLISLIIIAHNLK